MWAIPFRNQFYSTTFSTAPENPISEGNIWHHANFGNALIQTVTTPNRAVGTQSGSGGFNDSFAWLSRFPPNVSVQATVYKDPTIDTVNGAHEIELHLRMIDTSTQNRGYECNWSSGGFYSQIVRWDPTSFTFLAGQFNSSFTAPSTGDIVRADIVGGTITTFIMYLGSGVWTQLQQATDNTYADGQPGIGMWLNTTAGGLAAGQNKYGFTNFSVTALYNG